MVERLIQYLSSKFFGWVLNYSYFSFQASNFNWYHFGHVNLICVHWDGTNKILERIWWHIYLIFYVNTSSHVIRICRYTTTSKKATWPSLLTSPQGWRGMWSVNKNGYVALSNGMSCSHMQMAHWTGVNVVNSACISSNYLYNSLGTLLVNTS